MTPDQGNRRLQRVNMGVREGREDKPAPQVDPGQMTVGGKTLDLILPLQNATMVNHHGVELLEGVIGSVPANEVDEDHRRIGHTTRAGRRKKP